MRDYSDIRKSADLWATEWAIKRRNRKIIRIVLIVVLIAAVTAVTRIATIYITRTTFADADQMKWAMQGRYMCGNFEEIEIDGTQMYITYYNVNDGVENPQMNPHTGNSLDSTYEVEIVSWDYRTGIIKTDWSEDIKVDNNMNIVYHSRTYERTKGARKILRKNADGQWVYKGDTSDDLDLGSKSDNNELEDKANEDMELTQDEEESVNA